VTKILIESDLLLAVIKKEDHLKPVAEKILEKIDSGQLKGVYASTAAFKKSYFWLFNQHYLANLPKRSTF
jgi:hypothetical protein